MKTLTLRRHTMKNLMVRTHTFTMLMSRLVVMVLFAALLSAAPFRAALAQNAPDLGTAADFAVLGGTAVTATDSVVIGDVGVDLGGAVTQTNSTITGTVHVGDTAAQQAYDDFIAAYDALALEQCDTVLTVPLWPDASARCLLCQLGGNRDGRRVDARRVLHRYLDFQNRNQRHRLPSRAPTSRWS